MYERTYRSKVLTQKAPEEKKRKKRFPIRRALFILLGCLFIVAIFVLIRLPGLQVREVEVVGTDVADPEEISLFVTSQMTGNYLRFFPRTSMLLVPTSTLGKKVHSAFPRFASAEVRRKGAHGLTVAVEEHQGSSLWCESNESCFFMTKEGIVFSEAPFFSGDAYERIFIGEKKDLPFSPLENETLSMIAALREKLPTIGITPQEYRAVSEHQLDIVFSRHGQSALLMIDPENEIDKTLEDLATGLATDPLKGKMNNNSLVLEYLDARFANKVVYKFK